MELTATSAYITAVGNLILQ